MDKSNLIRNDSWHSDIDAIWTNWWVVSNRVDRAEISTFFLGWGGKRWPPTIAGSGRKDGAQPRRRTIPPPRSGPNSKPGHGKNAVLVQGRGCDHAQVDLPISCGSASSAACGGIGLLRVLELSSIPTIAAQNDPNAPNQDGGSSVISPTARHAYSAATPMAPFAIKMSLRALSSIGQAGDSASEPHDIAADVIVSCPG